MREFTVEEQSTLARAIRERMTPAELAEAEAEALAKGVPLDQLLLRAIEKLIRDGDPPTRHVVPRLGELGCGDQGPQGPGLWK